MIQLLQYSHNLEYRYLLDNQLMMMFEYLNYFENLWNEMIKEKRMEKNFYRMMMMMMMNLLDN